MTQLLKISEAASLALHTMVLLAARPDKQISTREIANTVRASEAHLAKVMQRLTKAGLVISIRGPGGGFMLDRAGNQITLLEVYEAIDGPLGPGTCLIGSQACKGRECIMGNVLDSVGKQVKDYLSGTKLSDLTKIFGRDDNDS